MPLTTISQRVRLCLSMQSRLPLTPRSPADYSLKPCRSRVRLDTSGLVYLHQHRSVCHPGLSLSVPSPPSLAAANFSQTHHPFRRWLRVPSLHCDPPVDPVGRLGSFLPYRRNGLCTRQALPPPRLLTTVTDQERKWVLAVATQGDLEVSPRGFVGRDDC